MDITFESFCGLVHRLGHPPKTTLSDGAKSVVPPEQVFAAWLNHLPKPFPPSTGKRLFRLLFPHEGSRRRYGLKETKLAIELQRILGIKGLTRWDSMAYEGSSGTGCLGREVELGLKARGDRGGSLLTLREVDGMLDELAASSTFSQLSQTPQGCRTPTEILTALFRDSGLSPYATSVLIQIILRDLRPLLDPLPALRVRNPTAMLRLKSNIGPAQLDLLDAMDVWDARMKEMYLGGMGNLDVCADACEELGENAVAGPSKRGGPRVGVNVPIPKCQKGRSIEYALDEFLANRRNGPPRALWAETKYDGYRMQIHVQILNGVPKITVFSKSKRNSTMDRLNTHSIILAALGLPIPDNIPCHTNLKSRLSNPRRPAIRESIILEAEVVPYNESNREGGRRPGIEEFWWLAAAGVTVDGIDTTRDLRQTRNRHLCLVFFDVLYLDGKSLLQSAYDKRRAILERNIRPIEGFSSIAERTRISLEDGRTAAIEALQDAFGRSNERREEELVLKAGDSTYTAMKWRWVKLKKDYIPNLGDCVDLILLGAGWDQDRARELRVDTSVITTFYLGVLSNAEAVSWRREVPHFEILFAASYGPGREELEIYNENIRLGRWGSKPFDKDDPFKRRLVGLSWTYHLPLGVKPPSLLFERPLCAEVMGAGFQKLPGSNLYELRFPRLLKIYDPKDRPWTSALNSQTLLETAHQALGYAIPSEPAAPTSPNSSSSMRAIWRSSSTMGVVDIPDTPTPSPNRPTPNRVQSAPNVGEVLKRSPPTPLFQRRSPVRRQFKSGLSIQRVLGRGETEVVEEHQARRADKRNRWPRTPPTSSPNRGDKRLASAILASAPKRMRESAVAEHVTSTTDTAERLPLDILPANHPLSPIVTPAAVLPQVKDVRTADVSGGRAKNLRRALSLRSRLKLALRSGRGEGAKTA